MSAKWPIHWVIAFTLSELDHLQGKMESSMYKLNIALSLNKHCEKLNKIWFKKTKVMKNNFPDYFFLNERDFKISEEEFKSGEMPSFRDVVIGHSK
jgi:hypothetical protein